jgi:hypothetical protein
MFYKYKTLLFILGIAFAFSCTKDNKIEKYTFFRPVYSTKSEVKAGIQAGLPTPVVQPGKIVWKNQFVFLVEVDKGVHIIDIANPAKPINTFFIAIPGCMDLAINGNYLYADCYTDLVVLDISNPFKTKLNKMIEGVFPHRYYHGFIADTNKVIAKWIRVDTTVHSRLSGSFTNNNPLRNVLFLSSFSGQSAASGTAYGVAGSMARFALQNSRLYTVSHNDLKIFNIQQAADPTYVSALALQSGDIETIFPYKQNLFIGSRTGMYIYNSSNPDKPTKLGQFTHTRSCDPVIADGNYAYVTLWGGSFCGGFSNQLDVVDIQNLTTPTLVKTYPLSSPKGLSKDGDLLFICDGNEGLKLFNAANPNAVTLIKTISSFAGTDVIAQNGIAIVTAADGLYCIDYSTPSQAKIVGLVKLTKS